MSIRLDHKIQIYRDTGTTTDEDNNPVADFTLFCERSASRVDASAGESYKAREVNAEISARFTVRYDPETATIDAKDRLTLENGLTYEITGVRETIPRNRYIEIDCVARAD